MPPSIDPSTVRHLLLMMRKFLLLATVLLAVAPTASGQNKINLDWEVNGEHRPAPVFVTCLLNKKTVSLGKGPTLHVPASVLRQEFVILEFTIAGQKYSFDGVSTKKFIGQWNLIVRSHPPFEDSHADSAPRGKKIVMLSRLLFDDGEGDGTEQEVRVFK